MKIIIDGYNVIHKLPKLIKAKAKSMELARSELFCIMQSYCDNTGEEAVIVYDGRQANRTIEDGNPTVIFANKNEGADSVIESLAYKLRGKTDIKVVTDDRIQANFIRGTGAQVISARQFEQELRSSAEGIQRHG